MVVVGEFPDGQVLISSWQNLDALASNAAMKRVSKRDQVRLVNEIELLLSDEIAPEVLGYWVMLNEQSLVNLMRQGLPAKTFESA